MAHSNKYRVTTISDNGSRDVKYLNKEELQKLRAKRLQKIRKKELGLSQKSLAEVVGVNLRTPAGLGDWSFSDAQTC